MFKLINLPVRSVPAAAPAKLPLTILQVIPEFVDLSDKANRPFNLVGGIADLLGSRGWEKVMAPRLWSPQRTNEDLRRTFPVREDLGSDPFAKSKLVRRRPFALLRGTESPQYEIIHLSGARIQRWRSAGHYPEANYDIRANLSNSAGVDMTPGRLRDWAIQFGTRLLILENPQDLWNVGDFARQVAGAGGPAVLIVQGNDRQARDAFLFQTYAAISHGEKLSSLAQHASLADVTLYLGRSADQSLTLDAWRKELHKDLMRLGAAVPRLELRVYDPELLFRDDSLRFERRSSEFPIQPAEEYLHSTQKASLTSRLIDRMEGARSKLARISRGPWDRESQGAIPLAEASKEIARARSEFYSIERIALNLAKRAPRVLNANFGTPERMIASDEDLVEGEKYDLCVDIGPRWTGGKSVVSGNAEFPSAALPQSAKGHLIEVVFSTNYFDPPISRAELWLPTAFGASSPALKGEPTMEVGPVRLPLRVRKLPKTKSGRKNLQARGRLCLYHENNLLQSAKVSVGLTRPSGQKSRIRNCIEVDFRLTGTYQDIAENFGVRRFSKDDVRKVGINITLNGDGGGNHRILVKTGRDQEPAWLSYDPGGMKDVLVRCRAELANVFMMRQENGRATSVDRVSGLQNKTNRKDEARRQFELDIYVLARLGQQLFNALTHQIIPQNGIGIDWVRKLQESMIEPSVIQIARTGTTPAQYVWPWGLLYSYPLPNYGVEGAVKFCKILKKWSNNGVRSAPAGGTCPYEREEWHQKDVLCPFGFWGLKHFLEQPLSPLVPDKKTPGISILLDAVSMGNLRDTEPRFGIGVTEDQGLDQQKIKTHIRELAALFAPKASGAAQVANWNAPATTREALCNTLSRAGVGYFLCHGETDAHQREPYLGLGPNPGKPENRIYPTTITDWARANNPDIFTHWRNHRPLVFINGCHTTDLAPGAILNFVDAFATLGAGGVVGTEISVRLPIAIEMAQSVFAGVSKDMAIAKALHEARWALANKGNLLGLAYTLYGLADFHLKS